MVLRSSPMVVAGPWPGRTLVSSGSVSRRVWMESMIWSQLPPGRSVRPMLPAKSVSPAMSSLSGAKCRQMEPWVWPGVWRTWAG